MSVFDNPALIKECSGAVASIYADVVGHLTADLPRLPRPFESITEGHSLEPVGPEILRIVEGLAFEVLGLCAAAGYSVDLSDYTAAAAAPPPPSPLLGGSESVIERLDGEIERTYRRFYDYVYADLPFCWRLLYTELSLLKFSAVAFLYVAKRASRGGKTEKKDEEEESEEEGDDEGEVLDDLVAVLDKALILAGGAGLKRGRRTISRLLGYLDDAAPSSSPRSPLPARFPSSRTFTPPVTRPIRAVDHLSMSAFQAYLDGRSRLDKEAGVGEDVDMGPEPLVLTSLMTEWPALSTRPWSSPGYLMSRTHGGRRLVPVEVGRSYVDEGWTQELITFRELLARVVASGSPSTAASTATPITTRTTTATTGSEKGTEKGTTYLAQHELFAQLPHLLNDILTPDHCFTSPPAHPLNKAADKPELDVPLVNAWFGPAGTITPLHTDGYHNLLCQVVGEKYVRLYAPRDSEALCPRGFDGDDDFDADDGNEGEEGGEDGDGKRGQGVKKVDMSNTSAFDVGAVEGWDPDTEGRDPMELEEFRGLRYWDCVLGPGEVLYIPIGWWHYVRSLSVSFSVSFWWNGDHYVGPQGRGDE
ncbi:JmjC domain-containing protein [Colletotrichum paranaense]|uniref:JmjC domain-containing protein n=1 Tax=Colletotrichum paranaense TaxID=1914294 RepID=A0ABQ9SYL9_9PEZI|nr:JmjC domain-containing protein [Colletotrichum paranaense]KAK1544177.1 JmjC domain-containing protein [Colletotrichum paranaense]